MGNCLVHQQNLIRIMKTDGKIIEYKSPVKAHQVLSDFLGFSLSESLPVSQYLQPEAKLLSGQLYHLVPLPFPSPKVGKRVRFLIPEEEAERESGVVRIKLVITKKELEKMLKNEAFSVDEMLPQLQTEEIRGGGDDDSFSDVIEAKGWRPALQSIPEVN